ncbi:beta-ketoacyl reductase [Streptomyces sp. HSW2009]|uniref:type I polyketide synthase n=1 Tax=Streptomyces sp. HSW2009 TaxID=3142890 RepID=UPI0032EDE2CB
MQQWLAEDGDRPLVVVTERGVGIAQHEPVDAGSAAVWGLLRSAQAESPGRITVLDVEPDTRLTPELVTAVAHSEEPQLALRKGEFHAPRLTRVEVPDAPGTDVAASQASAADASGQDAETDAGGGPVRLRPGGSVVVTGGTGDLGALVARHLVDRYGVRHLVLASRRGAEAAGARELQAELVAAGARVELVSCDVTDRAAVSALLASVPDDHPLTGLVHCAGALDDGVIEALTDERVDRVFAPKLDALYHLDEVTRGLDLPLFAVFSSAAGVLGTAGQANYAAANAAVDAVVRARHAAGLPGVSMAWGWWGQGTGLTGKLNEADRERFARSGVAAMSAAEGLALFDAALAHGAPLLVPVKLNLARLATAGSVPPLLSALAPAGAAATRRTAADGGGADGGSLRERLAALPAADRERHLVDLVAGQVAAVLGHSGAAGVEVGKPFTALGFDSLTAVELRNRLGQATGLRLPATLTFDHPTPLVLARFLLGEVLPSETETLDWAMREIDKMESLLADLPPEDTVRARVQDRLRVLLSRTGETAGELSGAAVTEHLQSSSAEELFEFVDRQLGT